MDGKQSSHVFYRKQGRAKPVAVRGDGVFIYGEDGKPYLDASGGAIVVNAGHGIESIALAIQEQASRIAYAHPTMFTSEPVETLARRLADIVPVSDARLYFLTTGSEAVEAAVKFARQAQIARGNAHRYKVIGRWGSYHGASFGAMAVMGKPSMRRTYEPMFVDMPHIDPPYCYRCPFSSEYPQCGLKCAYALEQEIKRQDPDTVAGFIAEPVAGATMGAVVPPEEYWPTIRAICDQYRVLLIADEVMTGVGRTGKWFGLDHWAVQPDIMTLGKGLSSGYLPLSAIAARGDLVDLVRDKLGDFNHGGTFSHHPVTVAAGNATLDYLEANGLISRVEEIGEWLGRVLRASLGAHRNVGDIRGLGAMWGIELVADRDTREPFEAKRKIASTIYEKAFEQGLIIYAMSGCVDGWLGDHFMIAPPFTISDGEMTDLVDTLLAVFEQVF